MTEVLFNGKPVGQLDSDEYDAFLDHRHNLAQNHPLNKKALKTADRAVEAKRRQMRRKAAALKARAEKMLEEASELAWTADRSEYNVQEFKAIREQIEDAGYWAARSAIDLG